MSTSRQRYESMFESWTRRLVEDGKEGRLTSLRKFTQGAKQMQTQGGRTMSTRRSSRTFSAKNKQMTGLATGAIAMLIMAAPALSQETSGTDEAFQLTTVIGLD